MKKVRNILLVALMVLSVITMGSVAGTYAKYTSKAEASDPVRIAKWDIRIGDKQIWESGATFDLFHTAITNDTYSDNFGTTDTDVMQPYCVDASGNKVSSVSSRSACEAVANRKWITIIAPGTMGEFDIEVSNYSEVSATYTISLEDDSKTLGIPILYCVGETTTGGACAKNSNNWKSAKDFDVVPSEKMAPYNGPTAESKTITVNWMWDYETEDTATYSLNDLIAWLTETKQVDDATDYYQKVSDNVIEPATAMAELKKSKQNEKETALGIAGIKELKVTANIVATQED